MAAKKQKKQKYTSAELDAQVKAMKAAGGHVTKTQLKLFYKAGGFKTADKGKNIMVAKPKRKAPAKKRKAPARKAPKRKAPARKRRRY